jgi:cellulose biosynthesis protein BcsQ
MSRITLLIADYDELYVESLINFLMANYSRRFQISSFTKPEFLYSYLSAEGSNADILLIDPEINLEEIPLSNVKTILVMAYGQGVNEIKGYKAINKYQNADNFVSSILAAFSENGQDFALPGSDSKVSKVISVYSPVGGIGKTSICVALATNMSASGHKVFYLNMESTPSTSCFFHDKNDSNLSTVLFSIKGKSQNTQLKMEGAKCFDSTNGVYYFAPPDSTFEIEEMQPEELKTLVDLLKSSGQYDYVFIDLSSSISRNNIALLEACDRIILPIDQDINSEVKLSALKKELKILNQQKSINLLDKVEMVLNKFICDNKKIIHIEGFDINESTIKIPLLYSYKMADMVKFISHKTGIERLCR